jgi:hypothetical protein
MLQAGRIIGISRPAFERTPPSKKPEIHRFPPVKREPGNKEESGQMTAGGAQIELQCAASTETEATKRKVKKEEDVKTPQSERKVAGKGSESGRGNKVQRRERGSKKQEVAGVRGRSEGGSPSPARWLSLKGKRKRIEEDQEESKVPVILETKRGVISSESVKKEEGRPSKKRKVVTDSKPLKPSANPRFREVRKPVDQLWRLRRRQKLPKVQQPPMFRGDGFVADATGMEESGKGGEGSEGEMNEEGTESVLRGGESMGREGEKNVMEVQRSGFGASKGAGKPDRQLRSADSVRKKTQDGSESVGKEAGASDKSEPGRPSTRQRRRKQAVDGRTEGLVGSVDAGLQVLRVREGRLQGPVEDTRQHKKERRVSELLVHAPLQRKTQGKDRSGGQMAGKSSSRSGDGIVPAGRQTRARKDAVTVVQGPGNNIVSVGADDVIKGGQGSHDDVSEKGQRGKKETSTGVETGHSRRRLRKRGELERGGREEEAEKEEKLDGVNELEGGAAVTDKLTGVTEGAAGAEERVAGNESVNGPRDNGKKGKLEGSSKKGVAQAEERKRDSVNKPDKNASARDSEARGGVDAAAESGAVNEGVNGPQENGEDGEKDAEESAKQEEGETVLAKSVNGVRAGGSGEAAEALAQGGLEKGKGYDKVVPGGNEGTLVEAVEQLVTGASEEKESLTTGAGTASVVAGEGEGTERKTENGAVQKLAVEPAEDGGLDSRERTGGRVENRGQTTNAAQVFEGVTMEKKERGAAGEGEGAGQQGHVSEAQASHVAGGQREEGPIEGEVGVSKEGTDSGGGVSGEGRRTGVKVGDEKGETIQDNQGKDKPAFLFTEAHPQSEGGMGNRERPGETITVPTSQVTREGAANQWEGESGMAEGRRSVERVQPPDLKAALVLGKDGKPGDTFEPSKAGPTSTSNVGPVPIGEPVSTINAGPVLTELVSTSSRGPMSTSAAEPVFTSNSGPVHTGSASPGQAPVQEEPVDKTGWTASQVAALKSALATIDPTVDGLWYKIARQVSTKRGGMLGRRAHQDRKVSKVDQGFCWYTCINQSDLCSVIEGL